MTIEDGQLEELKKTIVVAQVLAKTDFLIGEHPLTYYGKISRYDSRSVTLNPYFDPTDYAVIETTPLREFRGGIPLGRIAEQQKREFEKLKSLVERIKETEAGSSTKEKTFEREKIVYLRDFLK